MATVKAVSVWCPSFVLAVILMIPWPGASEEKAGLKKVESPYTSETTGTANIHCHCILGTSGCKSPLVKAGDLQPSAPQTDHRHAGIAPEVVSNRRFTHNHP